MSTTKFEKWFKTSFGVAAPEEYLDFITKNQDTVYNDGRGGALWDIEYVISETDDRESATQGFCIIGGSNSLTHYLLRAKDGQVLVVDRHDYTVVDAWFKTIDNMISLMDFKTE